MSKFIALTRVLLKNSGESFGKQKGKKKIKGVGLIILMALAFLPLAMMFGTFVANMYDGLVGIGQEGYVLGLGLAVISFTIFFFGIFYAMNIFYFSMDIENLLPLPFKPSEIMGAKLITILIYEYVTQSILFLPAIGVYGVKSGAGIVYYIYSILIFLALPIIPIIIASLINMLIMRFTNIAKNKDRFRLIGGIIGMTFGIGINVLIQKTTNNMSQEQMVKMFSEGNNSLVDTVTKLFPTSKFAVNSLINSNNLKGLINIILFLCITVAFILIFIILGEGLYFKGVIGVSETASKRKKLTTEEFAKETRQSSKLKAYTIKELKLLIRTPIYFINCVLSSLIWPLIMFLPFLTNPKGMKSIISLMQNPNSKGIVLAIAFAVSIFFTASNSIASTAISREGKNLFILKYIPVSIKEQIIAKAMSGAIIGMIGTILMLIAAIILLKMTINIALLGALLGILGAIFAAFAGIIIDLNYPKLNWDTEQKAVKQNLNGMISMFLGIGIVALVIIGTIFLDLTLWIEFAAILVLFGILDAGLYYFISVKGDKMIRKIQQ